MPAKVKTRRPNRPYNATGRRASSAGTRRRILEAARACILERGYRNTTVSEVARRAGVNADTVYALVGRKPVILRELIETAISGTGAAVDAEERDYVVAMRAEPDPRRNWRSTPPRSGPSMRASPPLSSPCATRPQRSRKRTTSGTG